MKADTLESSMYTRNLDRSPYRNMSEKCMYCAYRNRPSSSGTICTSCSGIYKNKNNRSNNT